MSDFSSSSSSQGFSGPSDLVQLLHPLGWMKRFPRYIITEILKSLFFSLAVLTGLFLVAILFRECLAFGLPVTSVMKLVPYATVEVLRISFPVAILMSVVMVYGRMSGQNEVLAMMSSGISPITLIIPSLVLAVLLSFVAIWLNDISITWATRNMRRVAAESIQDVLYSELRTNRVYSLGDAITINVQSVRDGIAMDPDAPRKLSDNVLVNANIILDKEESEFNAKYARIETDIDAGEIVITTYDSEFKLGKDKLAYNNPGLEVNRFSLGKLLSTDSRSASDVGLANIKKELHECQQKIKQQQDLLAATAATEMMAGNYGQLFTVRWLFAEQVVERLQRRCERLKLEPQRRFSSGFTCFCFAIIGAPIAIILRRSELISTFFVCFLPILLFYYPLFSITLSLAKRGEIPPAGIWIANGIGILFGLYAMRRVIKT